MTKLSEFYKNKRVVITGNTGFKGSWLSLILNNFNAKVYGYSLKPSAQLSNFNILKLDEKINYFQGDVRDYKKLKKYLKKIKPHIIFHLAAQALVKTSYRLPKDTFETNFNGTLNILEISRSLKDLKSLILITSDKSYLNVEKKSGYKENDKLGGFDPYSASKAAAENVCFGYINSFYNLNKKVGVVTARAGNVIGGGDWSNNRIIPDFIKSLKNKKNFVVRSPNATRPWQYILDLANGYLTLGMKCYGNSKFNGSWNFGPTIKNSIRVIDIINNINKNIKFKKKIFFKKEKKIKETKMLFLNSNKSNFKLKWKPKFNIVNALKETTRWYQCYLYDNKNIFKLTKEQIDTYFKLR